MTDYYAAIENSLKKYIDEAGLEPLLYDAVRYSLMNSGKRIRPYLCLLVTEILGTNFEKAIPFACAIEMIHTYSLIHDDLPAMDNDDMRRGKPANHIVFGDGNAIIAGDALLTIAADILSRETNRMASGAVTSGALSMLNGQCLDINDPIRDENTLIRLYNGKTGGLFCAAILSAFYVSGGGPDDAHNWQDFALSLGTLFQITDDILDQEKDSAENTFTYLFLHTQKEAHDYVHSLVDSLLSWLSPYACEQASALRDLIRSLPDRTK